MGRFDLSDEEWAVIEPHFPKQGRGPQRQDDRRVLNGIFYILRTGAPWRDGMGHAPQFITAIRDGGSAVFGRAYLMLWPKCEKIA